MHNHPVKSAQKIEYNLKKLARFAVDAETRDHADDAAKERRRRREGREEERTVAMRRRSFGALRRRDSLPPSLPLSPRLAQCSDVERARKSEGGKKGHRSS